MRYAVSIHRSHRRSLTIQITETGDVEVRAPYEMSDAEIQGFLQEKEGWIISHVERMHRQYEAAKHLPPITDAQVQQLAEQAVDSFPKRIAHYAKRIGVDYGRVTIRAQKTRWGSCSSKGNLNFNCLLMLTPKEVQDYVIVHELCHRLEMNHSAAFWQQVERILPDYKIWRKWLKTEGNKIMQRRFHV